MSKKNKKTRNKPANIAPQQQQTSIENKSGEELALLLAEQYQTIIKAQNVIMQSQNNIVAINNIREQRRQALAKKVADGE